jgi:hypothetical protein
MTEHNHRRPSRKGGPKVKIVTETIKKEPGLTYMFGNHYQIMSDIDGLLTVDEIVADGHVKGALPTRTWRPNRNVRKVSSDVGLLSGISLWAGSGSDHSNGHRGQAKAARGAKKFVRTRIRFHENAATRKLVLEALAETAEETGHSHN